MTERQTPLFDLGSKLVDQSNHLTPDGKLKRSRKKRSNQTVSTEHISKKNEVSSVKGNNDKGEMTEYTRWINEH